MPAERLRTGDELRRPEIEVMLRPDALPSYEALIMLRGEHDLGTAEAIRVSLAPLFGDVLVDLGDCDFIDSTVIGALILKARELEREGYRLECVVPPERTTIARVLDIVQMRKLVTIHERAPGRTERRGVGSRLGHRREIPVSEHEPHGAPDLLLVVMRDGLTVAEMTMLEFGQADLVRNFRQQFENDLTSRMIEPIERLTGREVLTYRVRSCSTPT